MKTPHLIIFKIPVLLILAFLVNSCSPGGRLPCPETGEEIPSPGPEEEYVSFTILNETCVSICHLLISPNHCEYMGGKELAGDHPLRSGESVTIDVPPGEYAVWFEMCTNEYRADEGINVRSDHTHTIVDDPGRGGKAPCRTSLNIKNNADSPICRLWISISGSTYDSWNWVGVEHIQPGDSLAFALRSNDTYIIRAEDCDGNRLRYESDVTVTGDQDWTVP